MIQEMKIKMARKLFTSVITRAIKTYKTKNAALIIKSDEDYLPKFILYTDHGFVKDEDGESQVFKIHQLLNTFDIGTLEAVKLQFKFDLIDEISDLMEKYCKEYEIDPLNVSIMFQLKKDKNAYPILYNGAKEVKEVTYEEIFDTIDNSEEETEQETEQEQGE